MNGVMKFSSVNVLVSVKFSSTPRWTILQVLGRWVTVRILPLKTTLTLTFGLTVVRLQLTSFIELANLVTRLITLAFLFSGFLRCRGHALRAALAQRLVRSDLVTHIVANSAKTHVRKVRTSVLNVAKTTATRNDAVEFRTFISDRSVRQKAVIANIASSRRLVNTPVNNWTDRAIGWMTMPETSLTGVRTMQTVPGTLGGNTTPAKNPTGFRRCTFRHTQTS